MTRLFRSKLEIGCIFSALHFWLYMRTRSHTHTHNRESFYDCVVVADFVVHYFFFFWSCRWLSNFSDTFEAAFLPVMSEYLRVSSNARCLFPNKLFMFVICRALQKLPIFTLRLLFFILLTRKLFFLAEGKRLLTPYFCQITVSADELATILIYFP